MQTGASVTTPNQTSAAAGILGGGSVFNATLKGKINGLEETVRVLSDEIAFYASEIESLKNEKGELENVLAQKTKEIREGMIDEVRASDDNLKGSCAALKKENNNAQALVATLKTEKTNLNQHLLDLQRRVSELELMIGDDN